MPRVLITGASRGIGRATTLQLAAKGWDVLAGVRSDADGAELAAHARDRITAVPLDVTSEADVAGLTEHLGGGLDALVNNAGFVLSGPVEALAPEDVRRQFDVNVVGQLAVTRACLPALRASHGRIVFISSLSGRVSSPMTGAYSGSKFALEALADALRIELRPWKVPVSLVEPGATATDIWTKAISEHDRSMGALAPEYQDLYAAHIAGTRKLLFRMQKTAVPVEKVVAAVDRALTARRPRARYQVTPAGTAQVVAAMFTPTAVLDSVMARASGAR